MLRTFVLLVALAAGGLAAWLAFAVRPHRDPAAAPPAPKTAMTEILVASADLAQGQVIGDRELRWQPWPKDAVNAGYVARAQKPDALNLLKGSVVRSHMLAGEPIREERLSHGPSSLLASMLPAGKRAVAIRISAESTAGGFIMPNDRVDVIQTVAQAGMQGRAETLSRTILANIRVLAIDQKADEAKGQAVVGKTATLELSAEQAELIAAGQAAGTLSLALRSVADSADESPPLARISAVRFLRAGKSELVRIQ